MSPPTTAILFPGQGSQTEDMRETVLRERPDLLELVIEAVGEDPFPRAGEGTEFAQPAIFSASLAGWHGLGRPQGDFMAGHSLGELAALVAAGALAEADGLALVALRGRLMNEAGLEAGDGGMVAVLGAGAAERASEIALAHRLVVANDNSPQQVVLSGARSELPAAVVHARELGLRAMELAVTGAFHSPMMASAVPEFEAALERLTFIPARCPVVSAVTARPFTASAARAGRRPDEPVRWRETMLALHGRGREPLCRGRSRAGADRAGQAHAVGRGAGQCLRPARRAPRARCGPADVRPAAILGRWPPSCRGPSDQRRAGRQLGISEDWIVSRTGIRERRRARPMNACRTTPPAPARPRWRAPASAAADSTW